MTYLKRFLKEDEGQDMVEYGLLAAFISIVAITALTLVGGKVADVFNTIADKLSSAPA